MSAPLQALPRVPARPPGKLIRRGHGRRKVRSGAHHLYEVVTASASNFLSVQNEVLLEEARRDPVFWETLLEWESRFCEQSSALDAGTHIIVVIRRD